MNYRQQVLAEGREVGRVQGFAEGYAEGLAESLEQGRREIAEVLCEALAHRFGALPAPVTARVEAATVAELRGWFSRHFVAEALVDVFAPADGASEAG